MFASSGLVSASPCRRSRGLLDCHDSVTARSNCYKRHCLRSKLVERLRIHGLRQPRVYTLRVENGAGNAVETVGLEKVYGEGPTAVRALEDVSLSFPNGEFAAIMGPSGSGKSTLLHILGALDKPTSGRVVVGGTELSGLSDKKLTLLRRERMGFVFQFFNLIPTLSAEENVLLPVLISGKRPGNYGTRLDELLDLVKLT